MKTKLISSVTLMFSLLSGLAADLDPILIGSWPGFERPTIAWDVGVSGDRVCLLGSGQFWVIDITDPANPRRVGGNAAFTAKSVVVADRRVFVATDGEGEGWT